MKQGVPPLCPHFGPCGGCTALDRIYASQLEEKRIGLEKLLRAVPGLEAVCSPAVLRDPQPYFYRNKAIYPFAKSRGKLLAGFYRRGSHALVDVRECQIQDPSLTALANRVRDLLLRRGISVYDERTREGFLRALFLRVARGTGEMMAALVTQEGLFPKAAALAREIRDAGESLRTREGKAVRVVSVMRNLNSRPGNVVLGPRSLPLLGRDHIEERMGKFSLKVSLPSFFQVNSGQAAAAYRIAVRLSGEEGKGRVVDAYAGIGTLSLWLAARASELVGIEEIPQAVHDAKENVRRNRATNCRFLTGRVEEALSQLRPPVDLLALDPPRSGCEPKALEAALRLKPKRILYLSCSPKTFVRDLQILLTEGYRLDKLQPIDFFPHTEHLELVASLRFAD